MKLFPLSVCQFTLLVLCCVITARESDSTFVPGRCRCPRTLPRVRGQLTDLKIYPKSPSCNKVTVIVTMKRDNQPVCLNPDGLFGRQLIRCWNRTLKLGRDVKLCLRRRRRRVKSGQHQRSRQRSQAHSRKASSSN